MNPYAIPPFVSAILFLVLTLFVWTRKRRNILNFTLGLACFVTFWWQISWVFLFSVTDQQLASILVKVGYSGILFIPLTLYHFFMRYVRPNQDRVVVWLSYLSGVILLYFLWFSPFFINGFYDFYWGFYPKAGTLHFVYLLILGSLALRAVFLLNLAVSQPSPKRNQAKFVLFALIAYLPASSDFLVNYGFEFYPFGFIFILVTRSEERR